MAQVGRRLGDAQAHLDRAAQRIDRRRNEGELRAEALARIGVRRGQGGLAEAQLARAIQALSRRDAALAAEVVKGDAEIDRLEQEIGAQAIRVLALRQPMANDLREVVSSLKVSSDIERVGRLQQLGWLVIRVDAALFHNLPALISRVTAALTTRRQGLR